MELIVEHWEYAVIVILSIDKAVALSPSTWDDLIWSSIKKPYIRLQERVNNMSMLSAYIKKQVKKKGAKAFIIKVIDLIVKATPSKKDDEMVAKIKKLWSRWTNAKRESNKGIRKVWWFL